MFSQLKQLVYKEDLLYEDNSYKIWRDVSSDKILFKDKKQRGMTVRIGDETFSVDEKDPQQILKLDESYVEDKNAIVDERNICIGSNRMDSVSIDMTSDQFTQVDYIEIYGILPSDNAHTGEFAVHDTYHLHYSKEDITDENVSGVDFESMSDGKRVIISELLESVDYRISVGFDVDSLYPKLSIKNICSYEDTSIAISKLPRIDVPITIPRKVSTGLLKVKHCYEEQISTLREKFTNAENSESMDKLRLQSSSLTVYMNSKDDITDAVEDLLNTERTIELRPDNYSPIVKEFSLSDVDEITFDSDCIHKLSEVRVSYPDWAEHVCPSLMYSHQEAHLPSETALGNMYGEYYALEEENVYGFKNVVPDITAYIHHENSSFSNTRYEERVTKVQSVDAGTVEKYEIELTVKKVPLTVTVQESASVVVRTPEEYNSKKLDNGETETFILPVTNCSVELVNSDREIIERINLSEKEAKQQKKLTTIV